MHVTPLGDAAALVYMPDEPSAARFAAAVRAANPPWLADVVPAFASVGVFFDADAVGIDDVTAWLNGVETAEACDPARRPRSHVLPVCYELGPDLGRVAELTGLTADAVVRLHAGAEYTVFAIGFVPGFPYLGYLPDPLCGVGRLPTPRLRVEPGSVGLAGRQTGVYPSAVPGGWPLIGRTPLLLADVAGGYFPLRVGDRVRFAAVGEAEFCRRQGERL